MEKDEIITICSTENGGKTIGIWAACRGCETSVWLSDSTITAIKTRHPKMDLVETPPTLLCLECGLSHMQKSKDPITIVPITDKQLAELRKGIKDFDKQG